MLHFLCVHRRLAGLHYRARAKATGIVTERCRIDDASSRVKRQHCVLHGRVGINDEPGGTPCRIVWFVCLCACVTRRLYVRGVEISVNNRYRSFHLARYRVGSDLRACSPSVHVATRIGMGITKTAQETEILIFYVARFSAPANCRQENQIRAS